MLFVKKTTCGYEGAFKNSALKGSCSGRGEVEHLTWVNAVVKVFPVVQPDLGQPGVVVVDYLAGAARETVGGGLAEHVADVRAGGDLQHPPTHPDLPQHQPALAIQPFTNDNTNYATINVRGYCWW